MRLMALMVVFASGCVPIASGECSVDSDCGASSECSRTQDCEIAGTLRTIRLTWSIDGVAPTLAAPEPCVGVEELEVTFRDLGSGEDVTFRPVTCELGLATYDKFSPRFGTVVLAAYDSADRVLDIESRSIQSGENFIEINLVP